MMKIDYCQVVKVSGIISTDDIMPAHYKHKSTNPKELANHLFENRYPGLVKKIKLNSILVCDSTFGIGSSREQAVSALLEAGVVAIIAPNFGRIFFRNCWNLGLIAIEYDDVEILDLTPMNIDLKKRKIYSENTTIEFTEIPSELMEIFNSGGLLKSVKNNLEISNKEKSYVR